jgi:sulfite reductase (ferredoxin)
MIEDLAEIPLRDVDRSYYSDWGDPREYTVSDMGVGECAGEVVSPLDFGLAAAERQAFEAQVLHEGGQFRKAAETALGAMMLAARELVATRQARISEDRSEVLREFKDRFVETKLFWDPFAGSKFAQYLFHAAENPLPEAQDAVHRLVEEAQLFIEASHSCATKIAQTAGGGA